MAFLSTVEAVAVSLVATTIATTNSMIFALLAELLCPHDFHLFLNCLQKGCRAGKKSLVDLVLGVIISHLLEDHLDVCRSVGVLHVLLQIVVPRIWSRQQLPLLQQFRWSNSLLTTQFHNGYIALDCLISILSLEVRKIQQLHLSSLWPVSTDRVGECLYSSKCSMILPPSSQVKLTCPVYLPSPRQYDTQLKYFPINNPPLN